MNKGNPNSKKWRALGAQANDEMIKVRLTTEKEKCPFSKLLVT